MKHIGILAHSADGAALCFLESVRAAARRLGAHDHPEITLSILPMKHTLAAYDRGALMEVRAHLAGTARRLAAAGCDFFICPDNTAHLAFECPGDPLPLPGLHIADVVARQARDSSYRCVGLLGTRWTMEGSVYPAAFSRYGVGMRTPDADDRALVNRVILDELCQGQILEASREKYVAIIQSLEQAGCDAVALSCTEIPLLVTPEVSPLPTLDSTRLLAAAAVATALDGPLPEWRGGPVSRVSP